MPPLMATYMISARQVGGGTSRVMFQGRDMHKEMVAPSLTVKSFLAIDVEGSAEEEVVQGTRCHFLPPVYSSEERILYNRGAWGRKLR